MNDGHTQSASHQPWWCCGTGNRESSRDSVRAAPPPVLFQCAEVQGTFTNVKAFGARSSWEFKVNSFELVSIH